jgi:two-component system, NarL family, invasion response regulator UvrY
MTAMKQNGTIRVLIADDQNIMREVIRRRIEQVEGIEVVGESPTLDNALLDTQTLHPDVVIMNDYLPPMSSAHATALFRKKGFSAAILAITTKLEPEIIQHSFRHGVNGFMHKTEIDDLLVDAIRSIHEGERFLSPQAADMYNGHHNGDNKA